MEKSWPSIGCWPNSFVQKALKAIGQLNKKLSTAPPMAIKALTVLLRLANKIMAAKARKGGTGTSQAKLRNPCIDQPRLRLFKINLGIVALRSNAVIHDLFCLKKIWLICEKCA